MANIIKAINHFFATIADSIKAIVEAFDKNGKGGKTIGALIDALKGIFGEPVDTFVDEMEE